MAFKWCCKCVSPETEDVKELNYQQMMLLDVPAEVFAYERTLEELYLDSNKIRDLPRPLFHCHGLKVLSMSENEVRSLPPAIASLINLQNIDLSKNDLRGIPDNIKGCKHLTHINVASNPLEKLPEGFTQLLCLEEVYLNDTLLEFLPANFGRLTKLRILELRANNLNTLPKSIARLSNLERLDIGQNDFSTLPEVIGSLTNLRELWIDGNTISSIPSLIGNLKKLHNMDASHNHINSIAEDIGECKALSDLLLSDNELMELPHVLGEFKELTTLRCDENQLKELPKNIGQLINLEELVLNQNDIEELPPQIGLLRKLHMLNLDDNLLEELPPEIGSCSGLTILSVRGNRLQEIPAEVGHLPQIRVLNLAENFLKNLPVSILNLTQLTALWLSNNQSTPLTTLQQEVDPRTGQTVCINFMLPQPLKESVYRDRHAASSPKPDQWAIDRSATTKLRERQHIRFATDIDSEEPHSLLRAPTPYPKELRNMSKRQQKKLQKKQSDEEAPLLGEMVSPGEKDRLIKEAKVKKPSTVSVSNTAVPVVDSEVHDHESVAVETSSGHGEYIRVSNHPPVCDECEPPLQKSEPSEVQESNSESGSPVLASGSGPIIRKAKYVRRGLCSPSETVVETNQKEQKHIQEGEPHAQPQQPPPYHIAAARSKQAAHFLTRLEARINKLTFDASLSSTELQTSQKEKDSDDNESGSYIIFSDQDTSLKPLSNVNECFEIKDAISDLTVSEVITPDIKVTDMIADTKEANGDFSCEPDSIKDMTVEEQAIKSMEVGTLTSSKEIPISDLTETQYDKEDTTVRPKCKIPVRQDDVIAKSEHFHEQTLNKPWTFIQDKPVVSDLVVAPTPQRPGSSPSVTSPVVSPKAVRPSSTSPSRTGSKIPAPLPSYSSVIVRPEAKSINGTSWPAPPPDIISTSTLENSAVRLSPSKFSTKAAPIESDSWSLSSPNTTRIPQPGFYSSVHHSYHHSSKRSSISSHSSSNSCPGSIAPPQNTWDVEAGHNYQNFPQSFMTTDHNLNISTKNTTPPLTSSLKSSANGVESNSPAAEIGSARSPLTSKIPLLMSSGSSPAHTRKISSSSSPGDKGDLSMKQTKAWMFGPHKNATVFPVMIHKNPGLGFSITGGMSSPGFADKKENGIFISKIHPNGPASSHLLPGDKILEVDGIDFTKVGHDQAVGILKQTGSVVNMMISRNQ